MDMFNFSSLPTEKELKDAKKAEKEQFYE